MESVRIGRMARESGLSISALRFYDGAGVLVPVAVDPVSGYRSYAPEQVAVARIVAALRRVRMPVAEIRAVLAALDDRVLVDTLLDRHLRLLEHGLADARRALFTVRSLLDREEPPMPTTVTFEGAAFAAALAAVRFAVGDDPAVLSGVLLDVQADELVLVATDRFRLAVAAAPVSAVAGPPVEAVVPAAIVDRIPSGGHVTLTVDGGTVTAAADGLAVSGELIPDAFPDYRRLLPDDVGAGRPVDAALLATLDGAGEVAVLPGAADEQVGVNREFLLEAFDAAGPGQLTLHLDGPLAPLAIRSPRSLSLLMPVAL